MPTGGYCKLPGGSVIVALTLSGQTSGLPGTGALPEPARIRVLVHAGNRARALTRLRNLGLRAVYLRGNTEPPTPDEITAVLHHPDGVLWRAASDETALGLGLRAAELWHPVRRLPLHADRTGPAGRTPVTP
jgi:hypothetical protein